MFGLSAAAIAGIGIGIAGVGMIGGAQTAGAQGGASKKAAEEGTKQSKAKQEELNANSELQRAIQKINNDRIMRSADKTYAAAATNLQRNRAARQTNRVLQQVAQAEAAGAYAANTASKGIGGASADIIESTMALRDGLKSQLQKEADAQADYDAVQVLAGIIPAGWQQQDMTVLSGNQSQAAAVPQVTGGFNWAQAISGNKDVMGLLANLTTPSGGGGTGSSGTGLSLGGGYLGLQAPSSGSFWSQGTSTTLL